MQVYKVASSWRLKYGLGRLADQIKCMREITFHHVCRKSNALVDCLANTGVSCNQSLVEGSDFVDDTLELKCR